MRPIKAYEDAGYDEKSIETADRADHGRIMWTWSCSIGKVLDFLLDNAVITDAASAE